MLREPAFSALINCDVFYLQCVEGLGVQIVRLCTSGTLKYSQAFTRAYEIETRPEEGQTRKQRGGNPWQLLRWRFRRSHV